MLLPKKIVMQKREKYSYQTHSSTLRDAAPDMKPECIAAF